jgi:hypothetical protein
MLQTGIHDIFYLLHPETSALGTRAHYAHLTRRGLISSDWCFDTPSLRDSSLLLV